MRKTNICFSVNTYTDAIELIKESNKINFAPIIFIKYYIVKGFGIEWINTLNLLLKKNTSKKSYKIYVDANYDYGLSIELVKIKVNYIKIKSKPIILNKIKEIAKKNKVLLNPSFRIVRHSNFKKIKDKFL